MLKRKTFVTSGESIYIDLAIDNREDNFDNILTQFKSEKGVKKINDLYFVKPSIKSTIKKKYGIELLPIDRYDSTEDYPEINELPQSMFA